MEVVRLGVTGGIAAGKSRAVGYLKELGAACIDADLLGHRVYLPGTDAYNAVVSKFGPDVVAKDGTINRKELGAKVFGDPIKLKQLTDIVWPAIVDLAMHDIHSPTFEEKDETGKQKHRIIVLEAAVLVEAGWTHMVDKIWVFKVDPGVAKQRLISRNALTPEEAEKRIASQLPNEERVKIADAVFDTNRDPSFVKEEVIEEWRKLLQTFSKY